MAQHQLLLGTRVLVAEDDMILALDVERSLRDAGAEIFGPAKTVADATALARTAPLTCAVLDVNLGCELVFPAAHVLRERGINTIFCTGYDVHVLQQDWPDAEVLSKPVSPQRLISAIRTACWPASTMIPKLGGCKLEVPHEAALREIKRDLAAKAAFGVGIF